MQPESPSTSLDENILTLPTINIVGNVSKGILEKLIKNNLVSDIKKKENIQVAIASLSDVYPRVVIHEDRKCKGEDILEQPRSQALPSCGGKTLAGVGHVICISNFAPSRVGCQITFEIC